MPVTEVIEGKTQEELDAEAALVADEAVIEGEAVKVEQEETDTVVVTIGDQEAEEDEDAKKPKFVQLREAHREATKRNKELERQLAAINGAKTGDVLGPKPTLADADYDTGKYESDLEAWHTKKLEVDAGKRKEQEAQDAANAAWQAKLNGYGKTKEEFKVRAPDFDEAEAEVQNAFSPTQQGIIVKGSKNAAVLIYALGKNTEKLKEIAAIQDPVEFAFAVATLETQLKVSSKSTVPAPESRVRGQVAVGSGSDQKLAALRAAAEKSNDYTQVLAYKRSLKQKANA